MKKTIEEEMKEKYHLKVLLGPNAVLLFKKNEKDPEKDDMCLRYIENNSIREQAFGTFPKYEYGQERMYEINADSTAIALYREGPEGRILDRVYSINEHSFGISEFLDLEYQKWFGPKDSSFQYIKERGEKDGKHQN